MSPTSRIISSMSVESGSTTAWEIFIALPAPVPAVGGGGLTLADGQFMNLDLSGGKFDGERVDTAPWDGYFLTVGLHIRAGGR